MLSEPGISFSLAMCQVVGGERGISSSLASAIRSVRDTPLATLFVAPIPLTVVLGVGDARPALRHRTPSLCRRRVGRGGVRASSGAPRSRTPEQAQADPSRTGMSGEVKREHLPGPAGADTNDSSPLRQAGVDTSDRSPRMPGGTDTNETRPRKQGGVDTREDVPGLRAPRPCRIYRRRRATGE
jgi:hypothetical protein